MRAPGMTMMKLPLFAWGWLEHHRLPADRDAAGAGGGGDHAAHRPPFRHPLLRRRRRRRPSSSSTFSGSSATPRSISCCCRSWGLMPHCSPSPASRPYGYRGEFYSFIAIGLLSVVVWAHHFFTVGLPVPALIYFMFSTMPISLPLAVLFFCWIATMWKGAMTFETPMLFAVGFIVLFGIAGLTGPDPGRRRRRRPVPPQLLRRRPLPLRTVRRRHHGRHDRRLLLATQVDRPYVQREPGQAGTSG